MKLLALDLALTTGWAMGDSLERAHCGIWTLPGFSESKIDKTLGSIYSAVNTVCRGNQIEGVIIEAAMRGLKRQNSRGITTSSSAHGDRCLTMLQGAARAGAANAGVTLFKYPAPNTWRAAVLGNGYPKNPKELAVEYCRLSGRNIAEHDAAEAFCMLQFGLGEQNLLSKIKP